MQKPICFAVQLIPLQLLPVLIEKKNIKNLFMLGHHKSTNHNKMSNKR